MARIAGRRAASWALGLIALLALAPFAVIAPLAAAFAVAGLAAAAALIAHRRAGALGQRCDKLSSEVDVLSHRLVRLEAVAARLARSDQRRSEAEPDAPRAEASASLIAGMEEVTAEIGLLSGIVRELAGVVSAQDGEIASLKSAPRPEARAAIQQSPRPAPRPVAAPSQEIVVEARPAPIAARAPAPTKPIPTKPIPTKPIPTKPIPTKPAPWAPPPLVSDAPLGPRRSDRETARDFSRDLAIVEAFDGDGLETHLQPVVSLPQRKVVSYEAVARLRLDGEALEPERFLPALERHGRTTDLDRRMLQRAATIARHLQSRGSPAAVAYGLSPLSLFEPGFLRSLARLVAGETDLSGRLVVALPQASWRGLDPEQAAALAALRGRIGFILDRPTDLRLDPAALAERGISQVKIPADLLLRPASPQALPDIALEDLVAALSRAGITLVADRVDRESDVPDLIDLDAPLAQGAVFAPARMVRADVLSAPPPTAAEPVPEPVAEPEPPAQRRPFRDFLRRAG